MDSSFSDMSVAAAFGAFPEDIRDDLLALRGLILATAARTPGVGAVQETLKWQQPAYLTPETRAGSTIRLGAPKTGGYAMFVHCQTTILPDFQALFPGAFRYEANRAVVFQAGEAVDRDRLSLLIASALTYHLRRKAG